MLDFDICRQCGKNCAFYLGKDNHTMLFCTDCMQEGDVWGKDFCFVHSPLLGGIWENYEKKTKRKNHPKEQILLLNHDNVMCEQYEEQLPFVVHDWDGILPDGKSVFYIESFKQCPFYAEHFIASLNNDLH